jgi:hypothetical protein
VNNVKADFESMLPLEADGRLRRGSSP